MKEFIAWPDIHELAKGSRREWVPRLEAPVANRQVNFPPEVLAEWTVGYSGRQPLSRCK